MPLSFIKFGDGEVYNCNKMRIMALNMFVCIYSLNNVMRGESIM